MLTLNKYSFGFGDRFSLHSNAFFNALKQAHDNGIQITPIWNKSIREYSILGDKPAQIKSKVDVLMKQHDWCKKYIIDADHINNENLDEFIDYCDYFTIDVSVYIRKLAHYDEMDSFIKYNQKYIGRMNVPGMSETFQVFENMITSFAGMYLLAAQKAGEIYELIKQKKGHANFITEISMDEVHYSHSPLELFFILNALAYYNVDFQLISPKFIGRFNKNIDYNGDTNKFKAELEMYLKMINFAIEEFHLNPNLKLSIHSGSDKFLIYPIIKEVLKEFGAGIHVKTSGIGWLESIIVLSEKEGKYFSFVKDIYNESYENFSDLVVPYDKVIDINKSKLPSPEEFKSIEGKQFKAFLDNHPENDRYNPTLRQFMSCAYITAASHKETYQELVKEHLEEINARISEKLYKWHFEKIFPSAN